MYRGQAEISHGQRKIHLREISSYLRRTPNYPRLFRSASGATLNSSVYHWIKEAGAEWNTVLSPTATLDIENLEAFQEYEFRASYLGKSTTPNYSDVVSTFAL